VLQPLTIFEGPDCSGKSTAANEFWQLARTSQKRIHHGPYPGIKKMLPRLYVETMLPMLDGGAGQVWDRAWYSEPIYGASFRNGEDRVGSVASRHLERFALRHGAVVVLCLPPWDTVRESWLKRKGEEYLDKVEQLEKVYNDYSDLRRWCGLPVVLYDYERHSIDQMSEAVERARLGIFKEPKIHAGGNPNAKVVLVGDRCSDLKDEDCNWRLPFASFSGGGSSSWLTRKLMDLKVREDQLLWVNASDRLEWLDERHNELVIALGQEAARKLVHHDIPHVEVEHPQYFKRFREGDEAAVYELFEILEGLNP